MRVRTSRVHVSYLYVHTYTSRGTSRIRYSRRECARQPARAREEGSAAASPRMRDRARRLPSSDSETELAKRGGRRRKQRNIDGPVPLSRRRMESRRRRLTKQQNKTRQRGRPQKRQLSRRQRRRSSAICLCFLVLVVVAVGWGECWFSECTQVPPETLHSVPAAPPSWPPPPPPPPPLSRLAEPNVVARRDQDDTTSNADGLPLSTRVSIGLPLLAAACYVVYVNWSESPVATVEPYSTDPDTDTDTDTDSDTNSDSDSDKADELIEPDPAIRGFYMLPIYGDGDCLYTSIATHRSQKLTGMRRRENGILESKADRKIEKRKARELREQVATYMEEHWDEFPFVPDRGELLERIRGGEWGGQEEIVALAALTRCKIVVHDITHGLERGSSKHHAHNPPDKNSLEEIHVLHSNDGDEVMEDGNPFMGHYDLLMKKKPLAFAP